MLPLGLRRTRQHWWAIKVKRALPRQSSRGGADQGTPDCHPVRRAGKSRPWSSAGTGAVHTRRKRANNRAESSHLPVRRRERKLQGFKSPRSTQHFLSMHAATYNTFTVPRHLTTARTHRLFRAEAFEAWRSAAGVAA